VSPDLGLPEATQPDPIVQFFTALGRVQVCLALSAVISVHFSALEGS